MYKEIEELLVEARQGSMSAKERLLDRLKPLLISTIKRYYYRQDEMEDLIQEGNLKILESIVKFDDRKGVYFLGYLRSVLKFHYLNKHKERSHQSLNRPLLDGSEGEIIDFLECQDKGPEEIHIDRETGLELSRALENLTDRQREVLLAFYIERLSIGDIGERLGISYRTVVNTKTRALEILRSKMG